MTLPSEEEFQKFHAAIGEAISYWTQIERALLDVFITALEPKHPRAAAAAYYANINFRTKLDFVDRAVTARLSQPDLPDKPKAHALKFDDPLLQPWSALERRLRKKAAKRGNIAHFERMVFENRYGDSDGFRPHDLVFVGRLDRHNQQVATIAERIAEIFGNGEKTIS